MNTRVEQLEDLTIELIGVRILIFGNSCFYLTLHLSRLLSLKSVSFGMAGRHAIAVHIPHLALSLYIHRLITTLSGR